MKFILITLLLSVASLNAATQLPSLAQDTNGNARFAYPLKGTNIHTWIATNRLDGAVTPEQSLQAAYLSFLLADKVNIKTWDIVGDGTDETDKWNRMITNYVNPVAFFIPQSTGTGYVVNGSIKYRNGHIFFSHAGAGQYLATNDTTIFKGGSDTNALFIPFDSTVNGFNAQWRSVSLRGNEVAPAISLYRQSYAKVLDSEIFGFSTAVSLDAATPVGQCYFNILQGNTISYNSVLDVELKNGANVNWLMFNTFKGTPNSVFITNSASINHIVFNGFQGVGGADPTDKFIVQKGGHLYIQNNQFEVSTNAIFTTNSVAHIWHNTYSGIVDGNEVINYNLGGTRGGELVTGTNGRHVSQFGGVNSTEEWFSGNRMLHVAYTPGNTNLMATGGAWRLFYGPTVTVPANLWSIYLHGGNAGSASTTTQFEFDLLGDPEFLTHSDFGKFNINNRTRFGYDNTNHRATWQILSGASWLNAMTVRTNIATFMGQIDAPFLMLAETNGVPATPASGKGMFYFNTTGSLPHAINDAGQVYDLSASDKQPLSARLTDISTLNPGNNYYWGYDNGGTFGAFPIPFNVTGIGITNLGGSNSVVLGAGTNIVLTTNNNQVIINTSAGSDTDGLTLLPTVTTVDSTTTPIFTNAVANNSLLSIHGELLALESGLADSKAVNFTFTYINDGGALSSSTSFQVENSFGALAPNFEVDAATAGTDALVTVDNNAVSGTVKWQLRYKITTLSF